MDADQLGLSLPTPEPDPEIGRPAGWLVDTAEGAWGRATAAFSPCRTWRYRLSRVWDVSLPRVNWLMLNPSTADAFDVDPTVRRTLGFADAWGFGAVEVTNVFALRSTDPKGLRQVVDPVGPANDTALLAAARAADLVVAGWGVHATLNDRERHVVELFADAGIVLHAVRVTKDGHPGHPLYVRSSARPLPWLR